MVSLVNSLKRHLVIATLALGSTTLWLATSYAADGGCPMPTTYAANTSTNSNSPEQPPPNSVRLFHKTSGSGNVGIFICVPEPAVPAHVSHGDTVEGPCEKNGRDQ